jgi:hypothetical protein
MPRLCQLYPGICLATEEKARKPLSQGSSSTSQADTVQYNNNEQYNTQKNNSDTEQYGVTEHRTQSISGKQTVSICTKKC